MEIIRFGSAYNRHADNNATHIHLFAKNPCNNPVKQRDRARSVEVVRRNYVKGGWMELAQWQELIVTKSGEPYVGRVKLSHVTHVEVLTYEERALDGEISRLDGSLESDDMGVHDWKTFAVDLGFDLVA